MEKTISTRQWAIVKRTAQNVNPLVQQKQKLQRKIADLIGEYKTVDAQIQGFEGGIKALCEGLGTEQLVIRVVTPIEGKFDKDGKQVKKVTYEPSSLVTYNVEQNNYTVHIPEPSAETPSEGTDTPTGGAEAPAQDEETATETVFA